MDSDNAPGSESIAKTELPEGGLEESKELLLQPNQPRLKSFPTKQFGKNIGHSIQSDLTKRSSLHGCTGIVKQKKKLFICYAKAAYIFKMHREHFHLIRCLIHGKNPPRHLKDIVRVHAIRMQYTIT